LRRKDVDNGHNFVQKDAAKLCRPERRRVASPRLTPSPMHARLDNASNVLGVQESGHLTKQKPTDFAGKSGAFLFAYRSSCSLLDCVSQWWTASPIPFLNSNDTPYKEGVLKRGKVPSIMEKGGRTLRILREFCNAFFACMVT
jgi:hypothetical protein